MREGDAVTIVVGQIDPLAQTGLLNALEGDLQLCLLASGLAGRALEDAVDAGQPMVVILSEDAEHSLLVRLKSHRSLPAVLIFAGERPHLYRTWLRAEGAAYLARAASPQEIVSTVYDAAQKSQPPEPELTPADSLASLTGREYEVAVYLSMGWSHKTIAREMHLAESTVKTHSARVRRKLGKTKQELIGMKIAARSS